MTIHKMDKTNENWYDRFKAMKKELGLNNNDIAAITGHTEGSIRVMTAPAYKPGFPRGLKLSIVVFEKAKKILISKLIS